MPIITLPNIYHIVFREIDNELRNCVTLAITEKIREQMNYSFLYHAKLIESNQLIKRKNDFLCESACIEEVFDLPQTCANVIFDEINEHLASIWEICHIKYTTPSHFVFLLTNGDYKCTCNNSN